MSRGRTVRMGMLVASAAVLAAWVHRPALSARAILFDDQQYVTDNALVRNPGWSSARRFLTEVLTPSTVEGYYQPLNMISLMLDCALGGSPEHPRAFHRTSLALHAANTALVILLLYMLLGKVWVATLVGLLFGAHPMAVEPIAWIGERKTLLAAFFSLASLIAYVHHTRRPGWQRYVLCMVLFVLALLSKPTSTPLPLVMLLLDVWPLRRWSRRTVLEKLPLFMIAGVSALLTVISQQHLDLPGVRVFSIPQNLLLICHDLVFHPARMIWPAHLSPLYPFPENVSLSDPALAIGVVVTGVLIACLAVSLRWTPALMIGWLCFAVLLAPTLLNKSYSPSLAWDKYAYLPALGLLMALAWLLGEAWSRLRLLPRGNVPAQLGLCALVAGLIVSEARATRKYLNLWQDSERLYRHMVKHAPQSEQAHNNLGAVLTDQGRLEEALIHLRKAVKLGPHHLEARCNLGRALTRRGEVDEAIMHLRQALNMDPDSAAVHSALGEALVQRGDRQKGIAHYRRAVQIRPDDLVAQHQLGTALARAGDLDGAIVHLEQTVALNRDSPEAQLSLGLAFLQAGRHDQAVAPLRRALQLRPDWADAHFHLGRALVGQGQMEQASESFQHALRVNPGHPAARNSLGLLLARQGRYDEAIDQYRQALLQRPDYAAAHNNWGLALIGQDKPEEARLHFVEAVRLDPNNADSHVNLGRLLADLGQTADAVSHYRQALQIQPRDAGLHHALGELFERQGQREEAIFEYREAFRLKPDHEAARSGLARLAPPPVSTGPGE